MPPFDLKINKQAHSKIEADCVSKKILGRVKKKRSNRGFCIFRPGDDLQIRKG